MVAYWPPFCGRGLILTTLSCKSRCSRSLQKCCWPRADSRDDAQAQRRHEEGAAAAASSVVSSLGAIGSVSSVDSIASLATTSSGELQARCAPSRLFSH